MSEHKGRVKGTPNKKTQALMEMCEAKSCSPFEVLIEMCGKDKADDVRFAAAKEICQYLYPKRKALELSNDGEEGFRVIIEDYITKATK